MKKLTLILFTLLLSSVTVLVLTSFSVFEKDNPLGRDNTPGAVTFTVKTLPAGGNYSPKHVLAIWVEKDGEFVKTRKAMANSRKQYLYTWKAASNYNVVDAITGSTLSSHQTHTIEWDCTNLDGNIVPDGNYTMLIEFTDKHAQGPLYSIDFMKGTEAIALTPPNQQYFINMEFSYEPEVVLIADFTSDVQETCVGETVVFTDNSTGATSWQWDFGAGAMPATANTQGPHNVTYSTPGSKTVSLTIDQGTSQTKSDYIMVYPDALAGFTWVQQSRTISFTNTSQNGVVYSWNFGDGNQSTVQNPVHTYTEDGTYDVNLIVYSEMCGSDQYMEEIVINTIGISDPASLANISVYPNPGNGIFYISSDQSLLNVEVKIFDVQGREINNQPIDALNSGSVIKTGDNQLKAGIYFLEIKTKESKWQQKLLVK